jgi:asparagine synthase (glutamine-hydrolysing)
MCGIAGYSLKEPRKAAEDFLDLACSRMVHRGPDDRGTFLSPCAGVGLAQTRLAIQDLSNFGHQPMLSDDRDVALVFNGEIYNFLKLRAELEKDGHRFNGSSDSEVLLRLYLACRQSGGPREMLSRLNGIFAFAIWDSSEGGVLLARDALGVKPLYYARSESGFVFASELKVLVPPPFRGAFDLTADSQLDIEAVAGYLEFLWNPGGSTPYPGIMKLPPGEALWVQSGEVTENLIWYQLPAFRRRDPLKASCTSLAAGAFIRSTEEALRASVHRQLIADVPVGAFLSGGLDSSSIVALARERDPNIRCFTIQALGGAEDGIQDDLPYARRVAEYLKVPLEVLQISASRMAQDLPEMIAHCDEPLADPAPLNVLYISRLARESGMKVLLSGTGADDIFGGYRRHRALMAEKYWRWLPNAARLGLEQLTRTLDTTKPFNRRLRKLFSGAGLEGDKRLINYFRWIERDDLAKLFSRDLKAQLGDKSAEQPMLDFLAQLPPSTDPLERILALEQRFFLADHNLLYTDKMSMAAGVEVRVPFLDLELVEFAATVPSGLKQRGAEGKWILKKAMEPYLPREVIYRKKSGFGAPLRRWMRVEFRELIRDLLGECSLRKRGLFDPVGVKNLIQANDQGKIDASYTLFSLMCIEVWCRHFIDHNGAPAVQLP